MIISRYEQEKVALSSLKGRLGLEKNNNKSVREMARNVRVNNVEEFRKGSQPYVEKGNASTPSGFLFSNYLGTRESFT